MILLSAILDQPHAGSYSDKKDGQLSLRSLF